MKKFFIKICKLFGFEIIDQNEFTSPKGKTIDFLFKIERSLFNSLFNVGEINSF